MKYVVVAVFLLFMALFVMLQSTDVHVSNVDDTDVDDTDVDDTDVDDTDVDDTDVDDTDVDDTDVDDTETTMSVDNRTVDQVRADVAIRVLSEGIDDIDHDGCEQRADYVYRAARNVTARRGVYVDPVDLAIIWCFESGLSWSAIGDDGVSCGPTQIRTDFENRPSCNELNSDPLFALEWTADELVDFYVATGSTQINRYNGGGNGAMMYGVRHNAVRSLIDRAASGEAFDFRMYQYVCDNVK